MDLGASTSHAFEENLTQKYALYEIGGRIGQK